MTKCGSPEPPWPANSDSPRSQSPTRPANGTDVWPKPPPTQAMSSGSPKTTVAQNRPNIAWAYEDGRRTNDSTRPWKPLRRTPVNPADTSRQQRRPTTAPEQSGRRTTNYRHPIAPAKPVSKRAIGFPDSRARFGILQLLREQSVTQATDRNAYGPGTEPKRRTPLDQCPRHHHRGPGRVEAGQLTTLVQGQGRQPIGSLA